jgi:hypothetical protein
MNRRRFWHITAVLLACAITCSAIPSPAVDASIPWASWVPTTYASQGWSNPPGTRVTGRISNFLFTPVDGNANDTILYSELLVDLDNNTILANYIDLEEATGTTFIANPFDEGIPQASKANIDATIAQYTAERFPGTSLWNLIEFTFMEIWNAQLPGALVSIELLKIGVHDAVLLDYGGIAGFGLVLFVNLGTKAAILFDAGQNSTWGTTGTFNSTIQSFVSGFLGPLAEVLHAAGIDQAHIVASTTIDPAGSEIHASQAASFLPRSTFISLAGVLMATFPVPSFPFIWQWNQIAIIIVILVAIGLVIYYGISSYSKEKKKIPAPAGPPREQPWYS